MRHRTDCRCGQCRYGAEVPAPGSFTYAALQPRPWVAQPFEYYAAHFLVGSGLTEGDLDGNVRALAREMKQHYDLGVEHGMKHDGSVAA